MKYIIFLIFSLAAMSCFAHRDTVLRLEGNELIGLPAKYQPATFSYKKKELRIGAKSVVIPEELWQLFGDTEKDKIKFQASWYNQSDLPSYMWILNNNFNIFIELDTLQILEVFRSKDITPEVLKNWNVIELKPNQAGDGNSE